jgi:3-isopropylmalate/(R)-2-methylmalate dehydratase small subunit
VEIPLIQSLRVHTGLPAPLDRTNVDTDQIIPKQFLKRIERSGFGQYLFRGASILLAGTNFGCGSSREHAAWALLEYGFRVVIAPSFADIFRQNCHQNGIPPITLSDAEVRLLMQRAAKFEDYRITVDIERSQISDSHGFSTGFDLDPFRRNCLLNGLDEIELTLRYEAAIAQFEEKLEKGHATLSC